MNPIRTIHIAIALSAFFVAGTFLGPSFITYPCLGYEHDPASGLADLGIKFYEKMEYAKAREYFQQASSMKPDTEYRKLISYGLNVLTKYAPRLREIETLNHKLLRLPRRADKKNLTGRLEALHLDVGMQLLSKGGYAAIIKTHFDYIISQDPLNLTAYEYLGNINYSGMLYEEAIKNYKKALEIYPDNLFFQQRLGDIYVGVGNYDEARKCYEASIRLLAGSRLSDKGKKIAYLKRLAGKLPASIDDIKALIDQNAYGEVIELCKKRISMNQGDVTAITYMGIAFEELGRWQDAETLYRAAIRRNPDYPTPHFYLAKIYLTNRKNAEKAVAEVEVFKDKLRELLPLDKRAQDGIVSAQHFLVYIYHEILRDYPSAVRESRYLLELAPNDQDAHFNLALSYAYLDKKSMAYGEFRKVIEINPDKPIAGSAREAISGLQKYSSIRSMPYRPIEQ